MTQPLISNFQIGKLEKQNKTVTFSILSDSMSRVPYDSNRTSAMETAHLREWGWSRWLLAVIQACERLGQEDHSHSFWEDVAGGS